MEITEQSLKHLENLASEATKGPWYAGEVSRWQLADGRFIRTSTDKSGTCLVLSGGRNAEFIAAANPETVKALIAEIRRLSSAQRD